MQRLAETPELIIRTEDGVDVRKSEALRIADEEIARATTEAQDFQAAMACALGFGE